jgi:di/tricarboxylate transporter
MGIGLEMQQVSFIIILIVAFALFITERLRNDLVAILIILALSFTGLLTAEEALAGFSSEPAMIVAAIFVLGAALKQTGVSETIGTWIGRFTGQTYYQAVGVIMPTVALLSAFTHHLTTTAFMMPIVLDISQKAKISPSKLLMPLSISASLGTTITIVGAPAFLIASDILHRAGLPALGIFSIAPIGIAVTIIGTLFMLLVGNYLLPDRAGSREIIRQMKLESYFTELKLLPQSQLLGCTLAQVKELRKYQFTVVGWIRGGKRLTAPFYDYQLEVDDVLLVHIPPDDLVAFQKNKDVELHPIEKFSEQLTDIHDEEKNTTQLVQAVVAPRSDMIGRSLRDVDFRRRYGVLVVAFWRKRSFVREELAKIKLQAGDVLVLQGDEDGLNRIQRDASFLMLVPFHAEPQLRRKAPIAALIMLATIIVAVLNIFSLPIVMMAGAIATVLTGCLSIRQAYRAIDTRIFVFIAGAIPLGAAMEKSGTSDLIAQWLQQSIGDWSQTVILFLIFAIVGILTQFMSDAATTALFAPLALRLAQVLGHSPEAYVVTVAMASVLALLTPLGHHGNLLVYEPGGYRFNDFPRVGVPLTIVVGIVVVLVSSALWAG